MTSKRDYAIQTENLTKKFGDFTAVDNLSLRIEKGEIYGLLGPNGAGKTTTIKMLCDIMRATSGKIRLLGKYIPNSHLASQIGYMPQEVGLYLGLNVMQNLKFYGRIFGLSFPEIEERSNELLKFVELEDWKYEMVENLSGGMKHRISLICTLIHQPQILFLDEPTVGVDPELRIAFWQYFHKLQEKGTTILITTHYMDEARHCDRIGFMQRGSLIADDTPQKILEQTNRDSLEDAFMDFSKNQERVP